MIKHPIFTLTTLLIALGANTWAASNNTVQHRPLLALLMGCDKSFFDELNSSNQIGFQLEKTKNTSPIQQGLFSNPIQAGDTKLLGYFTDSQVAPVRQETWGILIEGGTEKLLPAINAYTKNGKTLRANATQQKYIYQEAYIQDKWVSLPTQVNVNAISTSNNIVRTLTLSAYPDNGQLKNKASLLACSIQGNIEPTLSQFRPDLEK